MKVATSDDVFNSYLLYILCIKKVLIFKDFVTQTVVKPYVETAVLMSSTPPKMLQFYQN